jgi:hypothetical protein
LGFEHLSTTSSFLLVWLVSTLVVITVAFLAKSSKRRAIAKINDFHWPGLLVIALIAGAVPAYLFVNQSPRTVEVPDGVAERPNIAGPTKD